MNLNRSFSPLNSKKGAILALLSFNELNTNNSNGINRGTFLTFGAFDSTYSNFINDIRYSQLLGTRIYCMSYTKEINLLIYF